MQNPVLVSALDRPAFDRTQICLFQKVARISDRKADWPLVVTIVRRFKRVKRSAYRPTVRFDNLVSKLNLFFVNCHWTHSVCSSTVTVGQWTASK